MPQALGPGVDTGADSGWLSVSMRQVGQGHPLAGSRMNIQELNPDELDALVARTARLLEALTELPQGGTRLSFLRRRLSTEIECRGLTALRDLLGRAETGEAAALVEFRDRVAVNYSCFWREPAHWPILTEHLRPRFLAGARVRLWSAACANGEEACSMAMAVSELTESLAIPPATGDWRILASDIATTALATAESGHYPESSLGALPARLRDRYLRPLTLKGQAGWQLVPELRAHIDFQRFDLAQPHWPPLTGAPFDLIFLNNVLIYFDKPLQARVLKNLAPCLNPDGILLTSRSEGRLALAAPWFKARGECAYTPRPDVSS